MKLPHLIHLGLCTLLLSCATTTAPDGSVTRKPDLPTFSVVATLTAALLDAIFPPPAVIESPVVEPSK